jgi:uncharacterized membrane protein YcaP (DUF421 family)
VEMVCLVFIRFAHDRWLVVLFLFVLVLIVRISGRRRVAHDQEETPVERAGGKLLADVWGHVVAPPRQGIIEAVAPC